MADVPYAPPLPGLSPAPVQVPNTTGINGNVGMGGLPSISDIIGGLFKDGMGLPSGSANALPYSGDMGSIPLLGGDNTSTTVTTGISEYIKQFVLGIIDGYLNAEEHLLIYFLFGAIFLMLIWVLISDQSPQDIAINVTKSAGKAAELGAAIG